MSVDRALRNAWLAELWKPCPELSFGERAAKRESDRETRREMENRDAAQAVHQQEDDSPADSTGCAQDHSGTRGEVA